MNVVVEKLFGGANGDDGFQRGRMKARELDGIESAPGNSHHANAASGPRLLREPVDNFESIVLLLIGIFAIRRLTFARACAADVDSRDDIATTDFVRVQLPIAGESPIILTI